MKGSNQNARALENAKTQIQKAATELKELTEFECVFDDCPLEAQAAIQSALEAVEEALASLETAAAA